MPTSNINWFYFAAPQRFYPLAGKLVPWFTAAGILLAAYGLYLGLWVAPTDATQGQAYRIIYVHVPTAWMSMVIYVAMAGWAGAGLVFNSRLSSMMACALAPTGALMTFLALWTGALWGKPTWGTWWVWDARLTSMLILLFLYFGLIALGNAISNRDSAAKACAVLAIVGVINIPIIKYSVEWWNTLHQGATFTLTEKPAMPVEMWAPLLLMVLGFYCFFGAVLLMRMRLEVLKREARASWVKAEVQSSLGARG